jgi:sulfite reductase beta subunit-like hemoprotein
LFKSFREERRTGEGFGDFCQRLGQAEVQRRAGIDREIATGGHG